MKKQLTILAVSLMAALAWGQSSIVKVEGGMVQGVPSATSDVTVFRGIPYAAPPVGDLRWKRPQPVVKWKGVKVADTFSNICWQPGTHDGAFHSAELWYMFHTLDRSWRPMTEADYRLADEVMDCWTNFVKYGNPNGRSSESWKPFTLSNPYIKTFNVRYGN